MCFWIQRMGFRLPTVFTIRPSSPLSLTPTLSQRERGLIDVFLDSAHGLQIADGFGHSPIESPLPLGVGAD